MTSQTLCPGAPPPSSEEPHTENGPHDPGRIARPVIAAAREGPAAPSAQKSIRKLSFISRAPRISRGCSNAGPYAVITLMTGLAFRAL